MFEKIAELKEQGEAFAVATLVDVKGSSPRKPGTRMIVLSQGETVGSIGGGRLEQLVVEACLRAISSGETALLTLGLHPEDGVMACGGEVKIFIEPIIPKRRLMILGAGHVGRALASVAIFCEIETILADRNSEVFKKNSIDGSICQVVLEDTCEFFRKYLPRPHDFIVIATGSHQDDLTALRDALRTRASFIGLLGSRKKREAFFKKLRKEGYKEEELERVVCPVGLAIGAQGPQEIAISIMAQIIERIRKVQ